ncbi:MAG: hypothetical protein EA402_06805 [Planctomycetota bacterium]|nr:MAG: hypothetical protein EA402_06805 [Planctomycetota bacterium]
MAAAETALTLAQVLPEDWRQKVAISPRLQVWRGPAALSDPGPSADIAERERWLRAELARPSVSQVSAPWLDGDMPLSSHVDFLVDQMADVADAFQLLHRRGDNAWARLDLGMSVGTVPMRQRWLLWLENGRVHTLVWSSSVAGWDAWRQLRRDLPWLQLGAIASEALVDP